MMASGERRVSVIVGATGSIGSALLSRLLSEGRQVVAVARDASVLAGHEGVIPCSADLGEDAATGALHEAIPGPVDLALFAPGLPRGGSFDDIEPAVLTTALNLKVTGMVRFLRGVDSHLDAHSRVVAVAGSLGVEPGPHDAGPGTVNAGLLNLMRQVSQQLGPRGVTTLTVAPGPLETPRLEAIAARQAERRGIAASAVYEEYLRKTSSGRLPKPEEVAWLVHTLLAPEAAVLHGSVLTPDGGVRRGVL